MDPNDIDVGPKVKRVAKGGSITKGEEVYFEFETTDGQSIPMHTEYGVMSQIVGALRQFAQMAQNDQLGRPGGTSLDEIVQPWRARGFKTGWAHDGSNAVVHFQTHEGAPVMVAMSPDLLETLRAALDKALANRPQTPRRTN